MLKRNHQFCQLNVEKKKKTKCENQISTLESMSNELFLELFEYFDLYSIYLTFYSLNSRLNSIIRSCQVHVNFNQENSLYFTSFIGHFIYLNIKKGRIRSLQSSIPYQTEVLVNDIVMDRFTSLRSLTLSRCSSDLVEQILNRIEKCILEKISISYCKRGNNGRYSLTEQLLSYERYPSLRSINLKLCTRGIVYLTNIERKFETLKRLEYFSIDRPSLTEDLFNIIHHSPNLRSLNTVIINVHGSILISTELTKSFSLLRLKLISSTIQISTLEYLIENFPNLIYLYLDFSTSSSKLIYAQYWIDLFQKLNQLKHVYIRMLIQLLETNLSQEQVRERRLLSKRPWIFTRNLINRMNTIRIVINK